MPGQDFVDSGINCSLYLQHDFVWTRNEAEDGCGGKLSTTERLRNVKSSILGYRIGDKLRRVEYVLISLADERFCGFGWLRHERPSVLCRVRDRLLFGQA